MAMELRLANKSICCAGWVSHAETQAIIESAPPGIEYDISHNQSKEKQRALYSEAYCTHDESQQDIAP